jgi:hypothetical protein
MKHYERMGDTQPPDNGTETTTRKRGNTLAHHPTAKPLSRNFQGRHSTTPQQQGAHTVFVGSIVMGNVSPVNILMVMFSISARKVAGKEFG